MAAFHCPTLAVAFALGLDTVLLSAPTTAVVCVVGTVLSIACQDACAAGRFYGQYQLVVLPLHRFGTFSAAGTT